MSDADILNEPLACSKGGMIVNGRHIEYWKKCAEKAEELSPEVRRLVIAARIVGHEDQGAEAMKELDQACEAFAARVRWDDEPADAPPPI